MGIAKNKGDITVGLIVIIAIIVGFGSLFFLADDNIFEETAENVVEKEVGLPAGSIDFTPNSPD